MSYFFGKTFWTGATIGVALFVFLNTVSYFLAAQKYEQAMVQYRAVPWAPGPRMDWGFPVNWTNYPYEIINGVAVIGFAAVGGTVFQIFMRRRRLRQS